MNQNLGRLRLHKENEFAAGAGFIRRVLNEQRVGRQLDLVLPGFLFDVGGASDRLVVDGGAVGFHQVDHPQELSLIHI